MKALATGAFFLLIGCVATSPQQTARPSFDDPSAKCLIGIQSDPQLQILAAKINLSGQASIEMMASKDNPTESEKRALSIWGVSRQLCVAQGRDFRAKYAPPGWANAYEWQQSTLLEAIAALYGGSMTYGQFNVERNRIIPAGTAKMAEAANRHSTVQSQQAQQNAATLARELREYQDRNNATMQMLIQQTQSNRPIRTDCNTFGNSINCTTR